MEPSKAGPDPVSPVSPDVRWTVLALASGWPVTVWQLIWALGAVVATLWAIRPQVSNLRDVWMILTLVVSIVLAFVVGWLASIIPAWFVFGPIMYSQELGNGGPFRVGDRVQILVGKYRGTITTVYTLGQFDQPHVNLGPEEQKSGNDGFGGYQLLRVPDEASSPEGMSD